MERNKNLIGISGKIGSGKDTIGEIIQKLTKPVKPDRVVFELSSHYEIKKFAGKLKQITCLLTGCTIEQLEDSNFKNSMMGIEWEKFGYKVAEGKTVFEEGEPSVKVSINYSYREFLQRLGTDALRNIMHENIWVNALFADYKKNLGVCGFNSVGSKYYCNKYPSWIITDVRFPNELRSIESRGGITIRVERDGLPTSNHESETALDSSKFDYVINNNGTMIDLEIKVKEILIKEEII